MIDESIRGFRGEFRWLSNFHPITIQYKGRTFPSTENAYQSEKFLDPEIKDKFTSISAAEAKSLYRKYEVRPDWDVIRMTVMTDLMIQKFNDPELRQKLLSTGDRHIEETNTWNDTYWGVCNGVGQNNLGKILMKVRDSLKSISP